MRRTALILVGVLVIALVGIFYVRPRLESSNGPPIAQRTALIEEGDIDVWVTGTGQIQPAARASLAFKASGNVGQILVQVGDSVSAGQELMVLDRSSLDANLIGAQADLLAAQEQLDALLDIPTAQQLAQAQLAVAQARDALEDAQYNWRVQQAGFRANSDTIDAAEARLLLAEEEVDRAKSIYDNLSGRPSDDPARAVALTNLVAARQSRDSALRNLNWYTGSPSDIQQAILDANVAIAEADLKAAEEALEELLAGADPDDLAAAQARVEAAQALVDQSKLIAPFDGAVMSIGYQVGDTVVPGQLALVMADLSNLHVDTRVDELDLSSVSIGQPVEVTLDALPDVVLAGWVSQIDLAPAANSETIEFPVRIEVDALDDRVRIGMTAAINILVAHKEDVVLVPNWALRLDSESREIYVTVLQPLGGETRETVSLGLRNEDFSEIVSGVSAGDRVGITLSEQSSGFRGPFGGGGD